jgi:hypothetical protein
VREKEVGREMKKKKKKEEEKKEEVERGERSPTYLCRCSPEFQREFSRRC